MFQAYWKVTDEPFKCHCRFNINTVLEVDYLCIFKSSLMD